MILLVGSEGSMGKRYQAIFDHLSIVYKPYDLHVGNLDNLDLIKKVLIATPTNSHYELLKHFIKLGKDILCEKPICKSSKEVEEILDLAIKHNAKFNMVFQYGEIAFNSENSHQFTYYDYYKTGNDGIYWDCLQIIALASGPIKIKNKSPIWKCEINDNELNIASMDYAYIKFIDKWLKGNLKQDYQWLIDIHKKVEEYEAKHINSNTGEIKLN